MLFLENGRYVFSLTIVFFSRLAKDATLSCVQELTKKNLIVALYLAESFLTPSLCLPLSLGPS